MKKYHRVKIAASRTFVFSRKLNIYIICINLATINQVKAFCNASSVWGLLVKLYLLVALIKQRLITTIVANKGFFPATKLISKSSKALGKRLTSTKIEKILADPPFTQTQGRVTTNEQFFKSSLILEISKNL